MNTSTTLSPPEGQNHDREDATMEDSDGLPNGHIEVAQNTGNPPAPQVAVEVAAVDEDVMDTTPDSTQVDGVPNVSSDAQVVAEITPGSPTPNGVSQDASSNNDQAAAPGGNENEVWLAPLGIYSNADHS